MSQKMLVAVMFISANCRSASSHGGRSERQSLREVAGGLGSLDSLGPGEIEAVPELIMASMMVVIVVVVSFG